jgi:hypothetical protein
MTPLTPDAVMAQIAAALPLDCRQDVIIIGSLAAGYRFFAGDANKSIRTKDVDCMFSPHAKAVAAAGHVTESLLATDWHLRRQGAWSEPGDATTPDDKLPMIRLEPPGTDGGAGWFLEMLGAPDEASERGKTFYRVATSVGHFAICSFNFLALAEWQPIETHFGVRIARPEMMALANMLHHPTIGPEVIAGTTDKRERPAAPPCPRRSGSRRWCPPIFGGHLCIPIAPIVASTVPSSRRAFCLSAGSPALRSPLWPSRTA